MAHYNTEADRLAALPTSTLFDHLESKYRDHMEWVIWQNREKKFTAQELAEDARDYAEPLEHLDSDGIALTWSDLGYPTPADADDEITYTRDVERVALAAIREYIEHYDTLALARTILAEHEESERE